MIIQNEQYKEKMFDSEDLFVCALGYEQRSYYLFDKINTIIQNDNIIVLTFEDCEKFECARNKKKQILKENTATVYDTKYENYFEVQNIISHFVQEKIKVKANINVHIDYSSMPRSWYCRLPQTLKELLHNEDKAYFWYVKGKYPERYEEYPSAGIDSFSLFSGRPTLRTENKRFHILALGYDTVRTQAMTSILDPDSIIVCNAYDTKDPEINENVKEVNNDLLTQARMSISLQLDDFSFMISKLCELAYEYQPLGDVIFVPDGPKPLILAISLVPDIVNLPGITCLHISRNQQHFNPIDITPKDDVLGFSIKVKERKS